MMMVYINLSYNWGCITEDDSYSATFPSNPLALRVYLKQSEGFPALLHHNPNMSLPKKMRVQAQLYQMHP